MIRVQLPAPLRALAGVQEAEVKLQVEVPTQGGLIDALEARFPALRGTLREGSKRRAYVRFFALGQDLSQAGLEAPLPDAVVQGQEVFLVLGALAGG